MDPQSELESILTALRGADLDEQEAIGRRDLSSLLHRAPGPMVDRIIRLGRKDNRVRNALAAARYYCGLGKSVCDRIDTVVATPFPAASRPKRKPSSRR